MDFNYSHNPFENKTSNSLMGGGDNIFLLSCFFLQHSMVFLTISSYLQIEKNLNSMSLEGRP